MSLIYQGRFWRTAHHYLQGLGRTQRWFLGCLRFKAEHLSILNFKHTGWQRGKVCILTTPTIPLQAKYLFYQHAVSDTAVNYAKTSLSIQIFPTHTDHMDGRLKVFRVCDWKCGKQWLKALEWNCKENRSIEKIEKLNRTKQWLELVLSSTWKSELNKQVDEMWWLW